MKSGGSSPEARARNLPVVLGLNVGFGTLITTFTPRGQTFERYFGITRGEQVSVDLARWVPRIPRYVERELFAAVARDEIPAPSVAPGVQMAAAFLSTAAYELITGRGTPVTAPRLLWCDALERKVRVIRWRRLTLLVSGLRLTARRRTAG
jgi:hypothetical protein